MRNAIDRYNIDFGSSASLRPSPMKLMLSTVMSIANPDGSHIQGLPANIAIDCASYIILPQLAIGGCTPMPRKLSDDSISIALAVLKVMLISTGATAFGNVLGVFVNDLGVVEIEIA